MMTLIIGEIDSGKTTRLLRHYADHSKGDGFALLKMMDGKRVLGFHAMRLSTGETHPLLTHQRGNEGFSGGMMIGPYLVELDMYREMMVQYHKMIDLRTSPIYIDEIGQWELSGQGFDGIIQRALDLDIHLICTVRDIFVEKVVTHYHIEGNYMTL